MLLFTDVAGLFNGGASRLVEAKAASSVVASEAAIV